jgi:hypothetical protein
MIVRHHDLGQLLYTITLGSVGNVLACLRGGFDIADETGVTFRYKDYRIKGPGCYNTMDAGAGRVHPELHGDQNWPASGGPADAAPVPAPPHRQMDHRRSPPASAAQAHPAQASGCARFRPQAAMRIQEQAFGGLDRDSLTLLDGPSCSDSARRAATPTQGSSLPVYSGRQRSSGNMSRAGHP